jgi:N-methylhydantoinase A/oxoprolinase/acetone carboxylase beta subunit
VVERLVRRRVLSLSAFTPTDASHVLGTQHTFDATAARLAAELLARQRDRMGRAIADDGSTIARLTVDSLVRRSAEAVLAAAFAQDGLPDDTVASPIVQASLNGRSPEAPAPVPSLRVDLSVPLIALGASAGLYYPHVADALGTDVIVPMHADVANAVGAVVGRVRMTRECTISAPQQGQFIVHTGPTPELFVQLDQAIAHATEHLARALAGQMTDAGAAVFETTTTWTEQTVEVGGMPLFVEGMLSMTGSGRPDLGVR